MIDKSRPSEIELLVAAYFDVQIMRAEIGRAPALTWRNEMPVR